MTAHLKFQSKIILNKDQITKQTLYSIKSYYTNKNKGGKKQIRKIKNLYETESNKSISSIILEYTGSKLSVLFEVLKSEI